jgi:hypothetical protein
LLIISGAVFGWLCLKTQEVIDFAQTPFWRCAYSVATAPSECHRHPHSARIRATCGAGWLGEKSMFRTLPIGAVLIAAASVPALAQQDQFGTATEAKVMLEKVIFAVKADKAKALAMFNRGEGGFKDRDLHPFCFNIGNGIVTAGPSAVLGKDVRTLKDPTGKPIGEDFYNAPREGTNEVSYMVPRPGADLTPVEKVSFVARAGDQGCGVDYYKYAVQQPINLPGGNVALPWQR